jgi:hypothetical protein
MSTRAKSRTWTRVDRFHHKEPNQLIYDQFAYSTCFNVNQHVYLAMASMHVPLSIIRVW